MSLFNTDWNKVLQLLGKTQLAFLSSNWEGLKNPILMGARPNLQGNVTLSLICCLNLFSTSCPNQLLIFPTQSIMELLRSCPYLHSQINGMFLLQTFCLTFKLLYEFLFMKSPPTFCSMFLLCISSQSRIIPCQCCTCPNANTTHVFFRITLSCV